MATKGSFCEMCSKRGKKKDFILDNGRYFCSKECIVWYEQVYGENKEE